MAITTLPIASGGLQQYEQIFTSSGTWTKPNGVKTCEVTVIGGGAGGRSNYAAVGGGAGGYQKSILDVSGVTSATITIGAGGTFNSSSSNTTTHGGGMTKFIPNTGSGIIALGGGNGTLEAVGNQGSIVSDSFGTFGLGSGNQNYGTFGTSYNNNSALFGYGNGVWVCLPYSYGMSENYTNNQTYYSTNGSSWSYGTTLPTARAFSDVAYGNGIFVAVRPMGISGATTVITSPDGINWTETAVNIAADKITFGNGKFVTVGSNGSAGSAWYSTNGTTWTQGTVTRGSDPNITYQWVGRAIWDGTKFTAFANAQTSGYAFLYARFESTDGINWTQNYIYTNGYSYNNYMKSAGDGAYVNGYYIMAANDYVWITSDFFNWKYASIGSPAYIRRIYAIGQIIFMLFENGSTTQLYYMDASTLSTAGTAVTSPIITIYNSSGASSSTESAIGPLATMASNGSKVLLVSATHSSGGGWTSLGGWWEISGYTLIKQGRRVYQTSGTNYSSNGGAGECSSPTTQAWGTSYQNTGGMGTSEGYCEGGAGTNTNIQTSQRFGCGGAWIGTNGYQGAVIIRWWA
jgi:hypothetical protein